MKYEDYEKFKNDIEFVEFNCKCMEKYVEHLNNPKNVMELCLSSDVLYSTIVLVNKKIENLKKYICMLTEEKEKTNQEIKDVKQTRFSRLTKSVDEMAESLIYTHKIADDWILSFIVAPSCKCYDDYEKAILSAKRWLMEEEKK